MFCKCKCNCQSEEIISALKLIDEKFDSHPTVSFLHSEIQALQQSHLSLLIDFSLLLNYFDLEIKNPEITRSKIVKKGKGNGK